MPIQFYFSFHFKDNVSDFKYFASGNPLLKYRSCCQLLIRWFRCYENLNRRDNRKAHKAHRNYKVTLRVNVK